MQDFEELLEAAEPNPLLARVDALASAREWDALVDMARKCRQAVERGKQLWPIAEHIDYRLALEAPGAYAASVITPDAGRFAPGPLTEVAASSHSFDELVAHLTVQQSIGVYAAERVIRGEDLRGRPDAAPEILELPMSIEDWEPSYALATYKSDEVVVEDPELPPPEEEETSQPVSALDDVELGKAIWDLAAHWASDSNGRVEVAVSDGSLRSALGGLGIERFRYSEISPANAFALMAWAAASGAAHGRRRGASAGRAAAWWAAAVACGLDWPPDPALLGEEIRRLKWFRWEPPQKTDGWELRLAIESPQEGWAAAISAEDQRDDTPDAP